MIEERKKIYYQRRKKPGSKTSDKVGVSYNKTKEKWYGEINVNGRTIRRIFDTEEEAIAFRLSLEEKYLYNNLDEKNPRKTFRRIGE